MLSKEISDQLKAAVKSKDLSLITQIFHAGSTLADYWHRFWEPMSVSDRLERLFLVGCVSAETGYLEGVKFSVAQGLPITAQTSWTKVSMLHLAAQHGYVDIIEYILSNGGEALLYLEAGDMFERLTPLGLTCLNKKLAAAQKLLEIFPEKQVNAVFTLKTKNGIEKLNPLSLAVDLNDADMASLLRSKGADVKVLLLAQQSNHPQMSARFAERQAEAAARQLQFKVIPTLSASAPVIFSDPTTIDQIDSEPKTKVPVPEGEPKMRFILRDGRTLVGNKAKAFIEDQGGKVTISPDGTISVNGSYSYSGSFEMGPNIDKPTAKIKAKL